MRPKINGSELGPFFQIYASELGPFFRFTLQNSVLSFLTSPPLLQSWAPQVSPLAPRPLPFRVALPLCPPSGLRLPETVLRLVVSG